MSLRNLRKVGSSDDVMDGDREGVDAMEIDMDLVDGSKGDRSSSGKASGMSSSDYELWTKKRFLTTSEVSFL